MSVEIDVRNLAKWLNEEQACEIDRQALARVLARLQGFNHFPDATEKVERMAWVCDTGKGYKMVGYSSEAIAHLEHGTLLFPHTTPPAPAKPWVGLTNDERKKLADVIRFNNIWYLEDMLRAAEEMLERKNT